MQRALKTAAGIVAALLLAGCATGAGAAAPSWIPKPSFAGEGAGGTVPGQLTPPAGPGGGAPATGPSSSGAKGNGDPDVVASKLASPVGLVVLPDGTALVGERTTGRIVRVQPKPGQPVRTVRTIRGIDASGDGGLLDLALSPSYDQDGLIFAYLTTATDNRIVDFTLTGPVTPVLTGIPKGRIDNSGRLVFGDDGDLYVATSDAGRPALAENRKSLAGKVLRITAIGRPAPGNPTAGSPVYADGTHVAVGLCPAGSGTDTILELDADGARGAGRVNLVAAGASYGWPRPDAATRPSIGTLPAADTSPGGCTVLNSTLYATSLDAKSVLAAALTGSANAPVLGRITATLTKKYGRLRTVVAAPDGALWITTSNRDGYGKPIAADERVLRVFPNGGAASNSPF